MNPKDTKRAKLVLRTGLKAGAVPSAAGQPNGYRDDFNPQPDPPGDIGR